jgi:hypothetical protein
MQARLRRCWDAARTAAGQARLCESRAAGGANPRRQLQQIEGAKHGCVVVTKGAEQFEHCEPAIVAHDRLAVDQAGACRQCRDGRHDGGKRLLKSLPLRPIRRTPLASRRARMRKPSCLISCSQSAPAGGVLAGDGTHGSIKPAAPLLRYNMLRLYFQSLGFLAQLGVGLFHCSDAVRGSHCRICPLGLPDLLAGAVGSDPL